MTNRTDDFNRTDSTTSIQSPSDAGANWVLDTLTTWGIASQTGYNVAGDLDAWCYLESSVSAVEVQVTLTVVGGTTGLCARLVDNDNYNLYFITTTGAKIYTREASTFTERATYTGTFSNADVILFRLDSANLMTGYQNTVSRLSATNSANAAATKHGLRTNANSAGRFNDFSITEIAAAVSTTRFLSLLGAGT